MRKKLFFLLILFLSLPSLSYTQEISSIFIQLAKSLDKEIDEESLRKEVSSFTEEDVFGEKIEEVINIMRKKGIFLHGFRVNPQRETLSLLKENKKPFIVYLKNKGLGIVEEIVENKEGYAVRFIREKEEIIKEDEFIFNWDGKILSLPLVNILVERLPPRGSSDGRFIITYSYHKENFEKLKKILDKLREEADREGKKFIYIDELGLIPKDSIRKTQNSFKLSEKEAFEKARKTLAEEIERFARGISTYDENPFYQAQYAYLAKYKIKSYMEELAYDNWRHIVRFDDLNIHNKAINAFCRGDTNSYIKKLKEYNQGFWLYNVKERDENFRKQIRKIAQENPGSIIFTLRGIGHYGLEERLLLEGFSMVTYVISEGGFEESLISDQFCQILINNGVEVSPQEERILLLRSFPEEALRTYLQKYIEDLTLATSLAKRIVKRMSEKEIKILARDISYAFAKGKIKKTEDVWEYVFNWAKVRNKILPSEIPAHFVSGQKL